ncbi:amino acid adenylation domain-containing protein [Anaerobacterium chartisolvens]|uniref:Amino acid adenylation domain-containing protein n=1 Tax=Anaerobacterium chartisolvens TaxID=1297424 RepID=A0A369BGD7_9FIRM|nr:non-ribosomal peptide synthetase/type I polyketide synthase [Anaerobacterium chartisolvens]RCX18754.1 amino acid adenylation domain-containing protein [Anaerobacterium chartisolvens]
MIIKRLELTEIQKGIYFDCQIDNPVSYNISASILFEDLQEKYFENALKLLVIEQEAMRSCLEIVNDLPMYSVHDGVDFKLVKQDISESPGNREELLKGIVEEEIGKAFDLTKAPLFRARLVKTDLSKHLFIICIHHIISDGVSLEIFKDKLLDNYYKAVNTKPVVLTCDSGFCSFIEKENIKLLKGRFDRKKEFWIKKMQGAEPLALQADFSAKQKSNGTGREKRFIIPAQAMKAVGTMAMEQEVTVFSVFFAMFGVLMNKYTQNENITLSSPFSYRPDLDFERTIGCFVSMLPIRFNIGKEEQFSAIVHQVSKEIYDAYKNIGYPNNLILRDSQLISMSGSPSIFDVSFVYDVYEDTEKYCIKSEIIDQDVVTFPGSLMVVLNKKPDCHIIKIQYKPEIFSDETIEMLGQRFLKLLEIITADINIKIENIDLMPEHERKAVLEDFNSTCYFEHRPQTVIDIFNSKAAKHPDRIALIEGDEKETYASVNLKANQLAKRIMDFKGKNNMAVGVQLARSRDMVITILAVLKAGCAYVPIDASYPMARKEFIVGDAGISLLITSRSLDGEKPDNVSVIFVDDPDTYTGDSSNLPEECDPFSLAYIMYTSGSTGKPKGVMLENHSIVNTLLDLERRFPLKENDIFLLKTAYTFDVSVTELFGWFMGEGSLLILEPGGEMNTDLILNEIEKHRITHINFVPSMFRLFLEVFDKESNIKRLNPLKWIFIGGEAVTPDIVHKFNSLKTGVRLENVYGPTECSIWASTCSLNDSTHAANVPIGKPLNETRLYVVEDNKLQPVGIPGELCLSGAGLARGYLNQEELTKQKFIPNPFFREGVDAGHYRYMYRTGDLARWLPGGAMEFLGRLDFQVKLRGVRMELGEIENVLAGYEGIVQAVVVVKKEPGRPDNLCAYYLSDAEIPPARLKEYLAHSLPAYMIPSFFIHKKELPLNNSGKVNRNILISDREYLKNIASEYTAPSTDTEMRIAGVWKEVLAVPDVGVDDIFFEIGGNSLSLIQMHNKLKKALNKDFPVTLLFRMPTVRLLAEHFSADEEEAIANREEYFKKPGDIARRDIAVIGLSVHVPGAESIGEFWDNLKSERECIHFYSDDELQGLGISPDTISSPNYVKAKGRIDGIDYFDPQFFEYTPGEVQMMSPQLRILYQGAWRALEDAGYYPGSDTSRIGIFLGGSDDFEWYKRVLFGGSDFSDKYQAFTLSTNHFLATRIAYKLDTKGPAFSALTGCSTTLVTPHISCQSLILGECDMAVAGGVTVELPNEGGYFYEEGMMFSPDGHCRPFDAKAEGTVFSNGMGLVVLKRLDDALRDGDNIYAVIKGSAINNDGKQKVGFVAPSIDGQVDVVRQAYRTAGIDPETVSYVEAHGTGTSLGDPIEVNSLTNAFASDRKQFCVLGSLKGNIGHADTAAGIAGLIKVALSLKHKYIPGTVNYQTPNPKIDFENTPFIVKPHGCEWKDAGASGGLLRAGINSFGVGGTNAHMILEEAPLSEESSPAERTNLLVFSAKSVSSLSQTSQDIVRHLAQNPHINLSDAAWTLQIGRKPFKYRKSLVINEKLLENPKKVLEELDGATVYEAKTGKRNIYFMFSGQGSQYQGMGRGLYLSEDHSGLSGIFKRHIDRVLDMLEEEERGEFIEIMYGSEDPQKINQTEYTQFAIFATGYALAKTMMELGINPAGMIGHSIGEVTAAAVAGVFELSDAVRIVRYRGSIMQRQQPGTMLAVMTDASVVKRELDADVWLALENTTNNCVAAGSKEAIERFEEKLNKLGIKTARVRTSHAFHTPMMEAAARQFHDKLTEYKINEPTIPIISNLSGTWIGENEMTQPRYWASHISNAVNFKGGLAEVLKDTDAVFVEAGAGNTLCSFARQHEAKDHGHRFINLIRHIREDENDVEYIGKKLGQLWEAGLDIDWYALKGECVRKRVSLPAYAFDRVHFPIDTVLDSWHEEAAPKHGHSAYGHMKPEVPMSAELGDINEVENAVIEAYKTVFGFDTIEGGQDFFDIGGDSLKAVSLGSVLKRMLGIKVEIRDIFKQTTPKRLAEFILNNNTGFEIGMAIKPAQKAHHYPLSSSQKRMYTFYLMDKNTLVYNLPSATLIEGDWKKDRMEAAVRKLMERHEALRTSFNIVDGQLVQKLNEITELPIAYSERRYECDEDLHGISKDFIRPFDLSQAPLFRMELVKTGENRQLLLFDIHHIIADGTAVEILSRDFNALYFGELEPLPIHYKDYAIWQNSFLKSEAMKKQQEFWLEHLKGELPVLELPADFERPHISDFAGGRLGFGIESELAEKITALSRRHGATNFMTMLSAWYILLARYSGQEEIIVGTPVSGRTRDEIRETVGMFVNMLAIKNYPELDKKYSEFLGEVKENTIEALKNQDYQFDALVEHLNVKRELNRNAVFDVSFDYHNMELYDLEIEGFRFTPCQMHIESASLDLLLTCNEDKGRGLECFIDYSSGLFKKETIERMAGHYKKILYAITENQDVELGKIDMLTEWDRDFILSQLERTRLEIDEEVVIQEMFERNAEVLPDKAAVILSDGREITYRCLNEQANCLAWRLIELGVDKDTVVGIVPQRDESLLIAMLGILKAGGAYAAIDPGFPEDRISYMISESRLRVLIAPQKYRTCFGFEGGFVELESLKSPSGSLSNPPRRGSRESLAYVIFTSGSTGMPKGVMVRQEGVINLISDHINRNIFAAEDDRIACIATPSFDIFVFESILPLCTGHSIYMADETEYLDSNLLAGKIVQYGVTHIQSPVLRLRAMVENPRFSDALSRLKMIVGGGETYPVSLMKYLQKNTRAVLYNMYGPTETTVTATVKDLTEARTVTVGSAIANTQLFIINEKGLMQPIGVYGELCIAGRGVSGGYINRPDETALKFTKLQQNEDILIYKTGDRARMLPSGEIELMGRLDAQVKIRGYRIELSEIENTAMQEGNVSYAVVKAFHSDNGNTRLALFYCVKEESDAEGGINGQLKERLQKKLPDYMMPAYILKLDKMPLLPNGKVNKQALVLPEDDQVIENKASAMPMRVIEKEIIAIWKDVLNVSHITVRDNFFDIGGNSFGLMLVNNRLNELLGYTVPLMQLFENPTVELLAKSFKIDENSPLLAHEEAIGPDDDGDIAVIGMYGRFPGAQDIDNLWENIVAANESVRPFSDEELAASGITKEEMSDPRYVNAKGYLEGAEYFDADFFNFTMKEANTTDPQIRLLHMCVWNALEDAGYNSFDYPGRIGLFAGSGSNVPWITSFLSGNTDSMNAFELLTLNDKDFVTTKVSYKLNLRGPSVNVQTACSTSLVAIHQAVKYLQSGETDIAVAGAVSISYPRKEGYLWHEGMIYSRDGHCRPFSDEASGTVSGNGCAVVVLKKLDRALRDNDHIYAVIKGSAINNDGREKIGFTAPSIAGQRDVIEKALKRAKISSEDIQYVEAHGTGTALGDPIEIEALKQAWGTQRRGYCAIGSIKANIGHLDTAAGVAGFIKAALVVKNRMIPPMINFRGINPKIDIAGSPFYINSSPKQLDAGTVRAAVSSFGIGGTNAHVIVEEAPKAQKSNQPSEVNILLFSARSESALINTSERVISYIAGHKELNLSDAAWTLQVGRGSFEYRKALVTGKQMDNDSLLHEFIKDRGRRVKEGRKTIVFVLQDSKKICQRVGSSLYKAERPCSISTSFEKYVRAVLNELKRDEYTSVENILTGRGAADSFQRDIAVFAVNYALTMTLKGLGVQPEVIYGRGIGKLSGLAAVNAIGLEDAVGLIRGGCGRDSAGGEWPEYTGRESHVPVVDSISRQLKEELDLTIVVNMGASLKETDEELLQADSVIPAMNGEELELKDIYGTLGMLWCSGCSIDWNEVNSSETRARIPLPGYVFDRIEFDSDVVPGNILNARDKENASEKAERQLTSLEDVNNRLAEIWNEVLGIKTVGECDDFFDLGGDSLSTILMASLIQKRTGINIPVAEIFGNSHFGDIARWLYEHREENTDCLEVDGIEALEERPYYETSSAQKRMFAVNQLDKDAVAYNLASVYLMEGVLDRERLKHTFSTFVKRHESFRTYFGLADGQVVQYISEEAPQVVEFAQARQEDIFEEINKSIKPFDLTKAPLIRVKVISAGDKKHYLIIDMHHIISDQSSIGILLKEFSVIYSGGVLPPNDIRYIDFAAWQNKMLKNGQMEKQLSYWMNEFDGEAPALGMYTDFQSPQNTSHKGRVMSLELGMEGSRDINAFVKDCHITPYMLMMASFKLLLWKYTAQTDIVVGTGVAGRRNSSLNSIVGMFVNLLPVRSQIDENLTIGQYLEYIKNKMVMAFENQDCQFDILIERLNLDKGLSNNPLFSVVLNYVNMGTDELEIDGLALTPVVPETIDTKYNIQFTVIEKDGQYGIELEYSTELFKEESIRLFAKRFSNMLKIIMENRESLLLDISIVTPEEEDWLFNEINNTPSNAPIEKSTIQIFENIVRDHGDNIALEFEEEAYTYKQLNSLANQLAEKIAGKNVGKGDKVAIFIERGPKQIISILGILKCGAVYIPIDHEYPDERASFMVKDGEAKLLLTYSHHVARIDPPVECLLLDKEGAELDAFKETGIECVHTPGDLCGEDEAYIIFTSGSTGTPKGAVICHKSVIRTVMDTNYVSIDTSDRVLQMTNHTFDPSVFDIFGAFLNGARLVMVPHEASFEMPVLAKIFEEKKITVCEMVTAVFNMLVDYKVSALKNVRNMYIGGEAMSLKHVRKAIDSLGPGHVVNVYGPTEGTVIASFYTINHLDPKWTSIPIGRPISNTTLYILDEKGRLMPPNIPGELCIGGCGVAKGYLNRKEMTDSKFINLQFGNRERVYRTGDRALLSTDGNIIFLGRIDFQVKLRGFRIELGEVEERIALIDGIKDVVVIANRDKTGSLYMAAYYTVSGEEYSHITPEHIRSVLENQVPDYMIPGRMKRMDSLKLTHNGKIDRRVLPEIREENIEIAACDAPRNETERLILEAMRTVLDNPNMGVKDDFFLKGGHSIKAIQLTQMLRESGIELLVNDIFSFATAEELAVQPCVVSAMNQKLKDGGDVKEGIIKLNDGQIDNLVQYICNSASMMSDMVSLSSIKSEFEMTAVQSVHIKAGTNYCGFNFSIEEEVSEKDLRSILANIVEQHQMMHCAIKDINVELWSQFDVEGQADILAQCVSYTNLEMYDSETQNEIIKRIFSDLVYREYEEGKLTWRLCCLKLSKKETKLMWFFDHSGFDGMCSEIIKRQILAAIYGSDGALSSGVQNMQRYDDYVSLLKKGPVGVSEQEIFDMFSIDRWGSSNEIFLKKLEQIPGREFREVEISIPLDDRKQNIWVYAYNLVSRLLREYTGEKYIPMYIVNFGRSYNGTDYYNCIGEFLDVIPVLLDDAEVEKELARLLDFCRIHSINFLTLIHDENLSQEYPRLSKALEKYFMIDTLCFNVALYNFQGAITEEERRLILESENNIEDRDLLAKLLISVDYDKDSMYITLECSEGLNVKAIEQILEGEGCSCTGRKTMTFKHSLRP